MKHTIIFHVLFIICILNSFSQTNSKKQDIKHLVHLLKCDSYMRNMVDNGIEILKKENPLVTQTVWNNIKNTIDYNPYLSRLEEIFDANYTHTEIKNLINATKANPKKPPLFKSKVQQELYEEGKRFGRFYGNLIKKTIMSQNH